MKAYSKFLDIVEKIEKALLCISVAVMLVVMIYQVIWQDSRLSAEEVRRLSSAYFLCRRRNEVNEMEATVQRKTLTMEDRKVLAEMWAAGERAAVIAVKLGVCPDTVYKELKRGYTGTLNELSRPAYDPARGQAEYQRRLRNRGRWRRDKEEHHGAEAET